MKFWQYSLPVVVPGQSIMMARNVHTNPVCVEFGVQTMLVTIRQPGGLS